MRNFTLTLFLLFCSSALFAQDVLMQNGTFNQCSGVFYDSGGSATNYSSNEDFVITICSPTAGEAVMLNFTVFGTQAATQTNTGDVMVIYDGVDINAPVIGTYSGGGAQNLPENGNGITTSAANTSGCLTIQFISNAAGNTTGWAANISCLQACQIITPTIDSTNPAANGAGVVQVPVGGTVDFTGSATFSEDGTGATYSWNFGDGAPSVLGQAVSHQFDNIGTYTTILTVTDTNPTGCSETTSITVEVLSPYIDVDTTTYDATGLVVDVLIDSPCAEVSNVTSSTGSDFGSVNGLGSFTAIPGAFGFEAGIILSTGSATAAEGPEDGTQSGGNNAWGGDADLENAINGLNPGDSNNASFIQFDFIPKANSISFDFIFASEEYGTFQCTYTDAFAFLLTDQTTGVTTNLAIVPGTTDVVSVLNVRDNAWNGGCNSVNPNFFDSYYGGGGIPGNNNPTNFLGYTVPMTALANVTPDSPYTIKLVIADDSDNLFDAAVFLGAGTFNLGGDLGDDITIDAGTAECQGDGIILDTGLPTATHTWFFEGVEITGETGSIITATQEGTYSVSIVFSATCQASDDIFIEFIPGPTIQAVSNITECNDGNGDVIFDLTENEATAIGTQDPATVVISFHNSQDDANNDVNPITNPDTYSGTDGEMIYIRIDDVQSGECYVTEIFTLNYLDVTYSPAPNMIACDDATNDGSVLFDLTLQDAAVLGTQAPADFNVTYYLDFANADAGTNALTSPFPNTLNPQPIFIRVESVQSPACYIASPTAVFDLIVDPSPEITSITTNTDICSGDDAVFTITGDPGDVVDYNINGAGTVQVTLDAAGEAVITVTAATVDQTITLEQVTNPTTTCFTALTDTATVLVNPNPTITLATNTDICSADDAIFTITGNPGAIVDYNLNNDGTTVQVVLDAAGEAVVTVPAATVDQTLNLEFVENPTTGCTSVLTDSATVIVNPNPTITALTTNTDICSGDDAIFTIDGTPGDVVSYTINGGATQQVAIDATGQGIVTVAGAVIDQEIILESVTNPTTGCTTLITDTALITVNPNPTVTLTTNTDICSGDDAVFTITGTAGDQVDYTINGGTTTQVILDATGEAIITVAAPTADQTMEIEAVENPTTTCVSTPNTTETITVNPLPTVVDPTPLEVCDDNVPDGFTEIDLTLKNNEISGGNPNYEVTYYLTPIDAENEANPLSSPYTNISNPQIISVRVEDVNTGCYDTTTLELAVEQAPVAFDPTPLEHCDPDSDGFGVFTLTDADAEITGGAPGLVVTYHETQADANNNVNPLASPYNNIVVNMQTIYVRVESDTIATECATFVELVLIVNPTPQIITTANLTPLEVCDTDDDGFAIFDLPTKEDEILNLTDADPGNDLDPTQYTITYYVLQANAEAGNNPIATPNAYTNTTADEQTIWVRVEDDSTECYKVVALDLIVNPLPVLVQPTPITLCDVNTPGDEVEAFNLEDANAEILNGLTGITINYYLTQDDADNGVNPLISPYTNIVNPQTIYIRASINNTGCFVSTGITLDLRVEPLPSPAVPVLVEVCDDDNDGFASFDLEAQSDIIRNGEPDVTITYYETQDDAQSMTNALSSPYANITQFTQTIYVVAQNDITGCFTIVELPLAVIPSPIVPLNIADYIICDDDNDGVNQFDFDAVITPQIYTNGQTPADFTLTYHTTQAQAESGTNPIVNTGNYTNNSNPQTIYIRLESVNNGCVTTGEFEIIVEFPPVLEPMYDRLLTQCDDLDGNYMENNDGITSFDLTMEDIEITGPTNVSWIVTYYETQADQQADTNAIPDPTAYTNTMPAQTIYIRVTDNDTGCFSFTTVTLRVIPNPSPTPNPDDLELCDDIEIVGPNDLLETFDLTQNQATIINNETGVTASYYLSQEDAIMGNNAIADPTAHVNEDPTNPGVAITPQTIYVRVTNGTDPTGAGGTGCYSLVSFDVIVNPLPVVTPVEDYVFCEFNTDDVAAFDLESMTASILNGQDPAQFTVTYHETQAEADVPENALNSPYTNTSDPQTIYVNITNTVTGCSTSALTFDLRVDEAALANSDGVAILYEVCDDEMDFDGDSTNNTAAFNLATQNPMVLDGQDPANYTVSYYDNQADADAGTNPLPFAYTNTVNPQVIIVRVDNDTPGVAPLAINLATLTEGIDFNADGVIDTIDLDGDGVFDIIDTDMDGMPNGFDTTGDGLIDFIDFEDDGIADFVDLNGDGIVFDNTQDSSLCYETAEITLQVNPLPAFTLENSYLICINTNGSEVINSPEIDTGLDPNDYTFVWSHEGVDIPGETGPSITPTQGGNYMVVVTDVSTSTNTQCTSSASTFVEVSEPPVLDLNVLTLAFADQHDIEAVASGTSGSIAVYEFSIDGGSWEEGVLNAEGHYSYTFTAVDPGEHTITVRDTVGCGEATGTIMVMDYPEFFTPNGDGYHDTWNIYDIGTQPDAVIYIFDRYGKLLKQLNPGGIGWDGTYNGNPMPTSDYWFTLEYREPSTDQKKSIRAHFTLKR